MALATQATAAPPAILDAFSPGAAPAGATLGSAMAAWVTLLVDLVRLGGAAAGISDAEKALRAAGARPSERPEVFAAYPSPWSE